MNTIEQIHEMTSDEILRVIFADVATDALVEMPADVAEGIVTHPAYYDLPQHLRDWAWASVE